MVLEVKGHGLVSSVLMVEDTAASPWAPQISMSQGRWDPERYLQCRRAVVPNRLLPPKMLWGRARTIRLQLRYQRRPCPATAACSRRRHTCLRFRATQFELECSAVFPTVIPARSRRRPCGRRGRVAAARCGDLFGVGAQWRGHPASQGSRRVRSLEAFDPCTPSGKAVELG